MVRRPWPQPIPATPETVAFIACLVPKSRDATLTREGEEALWQAVFMVQPEQRREFEPSSKRRKKTTGALAQRYGLSRTTVTKWRARTTTDDAPMGPTSPHSTVLTQAEEAMVVEFRRRTLLPLDDVLGCLRDSIPKLTRSSLHRCLRRHGISRLPENPDQSSKRGKFAASAIGYVHIDISGLRLAQGKLNMFLAIDRVSKFTYVEFCDDAGKMNGAEFLRGVV
jgi:hypothetical protein